MIGATKSEQQAPPLPKLRPPKPSQQPIFPLPNISSSLQPEPDTSDTPISPPPIALPPPAQDAISVVHNEVGSSQGPHEAPTEEPSAEEPPENDKAPQEARDARTEEPTAEEPPGPSTTQSHDPESLRPESNEDDGHLRHPITPVKHAPQEPHDAPAEAKYRGTTGQNTT